MPRLAKQGRNQYGLRRWAQRRLRGRSALSKILTQVQAQVRQIELIARHDERDLLLDQAPTVIGCQGVCDIDHRLTGQGLHLVQPGPDYAEGLLGRTAPHRQNDGVPQQFQLAELERIAQEIWQFVCTCPRPHAGRANAQDLLEVVQNGGS